jgi:hypothetical protein
MSAVPSREDHSFRLSASALPSPRKASQPQLKRLNRHWRVLQRDVPDAGSLLGCYDWVELSKGPHELRAQGCSCQAR